MKQPLVNTLKTRISIVREVSTPSATGSPTTVEELVKSCRASQTEVNVNEEEDGKVRALFTTAFIVRYDKTLTNGQANAMFVRDVDNYKYSIVGVVEKQYRKYLQINTIRRE